MKPCICTACCTDTCAHIPSPKEGRPSLRQLPCSPPGDDDLAQTSGFPQEFHILGHPPPAPALPLLKSFVLVNPNRAAESSHRMQVPLPKTYHMGRKTIVQGTPCGCQILPLRSPALGFGHSVTRGGKKYCALETCPSCSCSSSSSLRPKVQECLHELVSWRVYHCSSLLPRPNSVQIKSAFWEHHVSINFAVPPNRRNRNHLKTNSLNNGPSTTVHCPEKSKPEFRATKTCEDRISNKHSSSWLLDCLR